MNEIGEVSVRRDLLIYLRRDLLMIDVSFLFFFQFYDLLNIFKLNGLPSRDNPYLFSEFEYIQSRTIH